MKAGGEMVVAGGKMLKRPSWGWGCDWGKGWNEVGPNASTSGSLGVRGLPQSVLMLRERGQLLQLIVS